MNSAAENNKRIAKNTLLLYMRMLLIMGVTFYTSRVILSALGIEDFGLYNIIGGIILLFSFINNAMVTATQRFLNYELGRGNIDEARKIFSVSISVHFCIVLICLLLAETIGLWFLNTYIKIPAGREYAANCVYQYSVVTFVINILRAPYNAAIVAYERMAFYAYISIVESLCRLIIAVVIVLFLDKLIAYTALLCLVTFLISIGYYWYCKRNFSICSYNFEINKKYFIAISSFSGWSMFGAVTNIGASQGINIILNMFFGVAVNAASGIANQVNSAVYQFVSNFQIAFNPQITKLYAKKDFDQFFKLLFNTSRYSFFLMFVLSLPLIVFCNDILQLWLVSVPEYAVQFCQIMIICSLFDALSGPLWASVYASGAIKKYQLYISLLLSSITILAYFVATVGANPCVVLLVKLMINILIYFFRLFYCVCHLNLNLSRYFKEVFFKCLLITLIDSILVLYLSEYANVFIMIPLTILFILLSIYLLGLTKIEKKNVTQKLFKLCSRFLISVK